MAGSASDGRTLTQRELNRALLARQGLLERARTTPPRVLERIGGIQTQYAPSMYVGLWSRLERFERDDLTRALERRTVVQGTLMRATIHLVSAGDYWPFAVATRDARRAWWVRVQPDRPTERELSDAARRLRQRLRDGPLPRSEVEAVVGRRLLNGVGMWVDMVRVPPSGTWERRRADLYAAAEEWVGPPPPDLTPASALDHLVRRYLRGFGPAPRIDIADFAAVPVKEIASVLERLQLRRFRDEQGRELLDLPRAPLPHPDTPAPVRFIPTWDSTLLVHARRTGILPEPYRSRIFHTKNPQSVPTFIVDGAVAGTWKYGDGHVLTEPFGRLDRVTRKDVDEEAERLAAFHA